MGGWAQENPPKHWVWRFTLGLLGLAELALAAVSIPMTIRHWDTPTALQSGTVPLLIYIVVFWVQVLLAAVLALLAVRAGRSDLIASLVPAVVGVHLFALAPVFAQPVLYLAAVLLTAMAVIAALIPDSTADRSFWCGILGAPVLLSIGVWATVAASTAPLARGKPPLTDDADSPGDALDLGQRVRGQENLLALPRNGGQPRRFNKTGANRHRA